MKRLPKYPWFLKNNQAAAEISTKGSLKAAHRVVWHTDLNAAEEVRKAVKYIIIT
jgi:hypothetical protein